MGRQEDAHEYLVALLDAMHEASLAPLHPKPPREVAETSLIYRIFAGTSRSQVPALSCAELNPERASAHLQTWCSRLLDCEYVWTLPARSDLW